MRKLKNAETQKCGISEMWSIGNVEYRKCGASEMCRHWRLRQVLLHIWRMRQISISKHFRAVAVAAGGCRNRWLLQPECLLQHVANARAQAIGKPLYQFAGAADTGNGT